MFKIIVAHAPNRVIGNGIHIPWHIKEEFQHFKKTTLNHTIIMGSTTFLSIGKPLPNRHTIIINNNPNVDTMGQELCTDLNDVINKYKDSSEVVFVCGGASIYRQMLPYCNLAHVTKIRHAYEADTYFPNLDEMEDWEVTGVSDEQTYFDLEYEFVRYERVK